MVNLKSTNIEIEQENLDGSSSQLTKFIDPRPEPNKWLAATFLDLLKRSNEEAEAMEALKWAIPQLCHYIDPVLVDQVFADWIEQYLEILDNNQNKADN